MAEPYPSMPVRITARRPSDPVRIVGEIDFDLINSDGAADGEVLQSNGLGGVEFGPVGSGAIDSGAAADGSTLQADGAGGSEWVASATQVQVLAGTAGPKIDPAVLALKQSQDGEYLQWISGVINANGGAWSILDDATHEAINVGAINTTANLTRPDGSAFKGQVLSFESGWGVTRNNVKAFNLTSYADMENGFFACCSLGTGSAIIRLYQRRTVKGRVYHDGANWQVSGDISSISTVDFAADGVIYVNWRYKMFQPVQAVFVSNKAQFQAVRRTSYPWQIQTDAVILYDWAGAAVKTASTNWDVDVVRTSDWYVSADDAAAPSTLFYFIGLVGMTP